MSLAAWVRWHSEGTRDSPAHPHPLSGSAWPREGAPRGSHRGAQAPAPWRRTALPSGARVPRNGARVPASEQRCNPEGPQGALHSSTCPAGEQPRKGCSGQGPPPRNLREPQLGLHSLTQGRKREQGTRRTWPSPCRGLSGGRSLASSAHLCGRRGPLSPHGWETRPVTLPACMQRASSLLSQTHPGTAPLTGERPARSPGPVRPGRPSGPGPGLCKNVSRAALRTGQPGGVLLLSTLRGWAMMEPPGKAPSQAGSQGPGPAMPVSTARGRLGRCTQNLQVRQDASQGSGYTGSPPLWTAPPFPAWH